MTKQLERFNIKPPYSTRPLPTSGHRGITRRSKTNYYSVRILPQKAKQQTGLKRALCYKFVMILKNKSNII